MKSIANPSQTLSRSRNVLFALALAGLGGLVSVHAQGSSSAGKSAMSPVDSYAAMCMQAVNFPDPFGEADLKGNAKLPAYCKCFGEKFLERAMKVNTSAPPPPLEQQNAEELAMRQSCRSQFNLPAPKKR